MPLTDGDYILKTQFDEPDVFGSRVFANVWYFKRLVGDGDAIALVDGFRNQFLPAIESILPDYLSDTMQIEALSLDPLAPDDTGFIAEPMAGTFASTEAAPSFVAAGFRIARDTRQNKRHGSKRFGPLSESMINGNQPTSAYFTVLTAAANVFNLDVTAGVSRWRVAIPQSVKVPDSLGSEDFHYELQNIFPMEQMLFARITSQNSRK